VGDNAMFFSQVQSTYIEEQQLLIPVAWQNAIEFEKTHI